MRPLAIGTLLISGALACIGQTGREPYTFFKESIGLDDAQIADIQHGKAVAKVLPTKTPSEVAVFGAVYVHASPEDYLKAAQNLNSLRSPVNKQVPILCSRAGEDRQFNGSQSIGGASQCVSETRLGSTHLDHIRFGCGTSLARDRTRDTLRSYKRSLCSRIENSR